MKPLLAFLFCLLTLTTHAQAPWPRNPKTGKVEFTGVLPWPATAKTEAQRQALVKRWYLAKLTDSSPAEVAADAATNQTNGLLTYAGLPEVAVLRNGSGDTALFLTYEVALVNRSNGLSILLTNLAAGRNNAEDTPLEDHLTAPVENEQAALAVLRKRLVGAVASWR